MADIFISYAREDRETAERLARALETRGWTVWWDRHLRSFRPLQLEITQQLAEARCVIVLWSAHALVSHWVIDEAAEGRDRGVLVSVRIDQARPPLGFRGFHVHDLSSWTKTADGVDLVFGDIAALIGDVGATAAPSPGAFAPPSPASGRGSSQRAEARVAEEQKPLPPGEVGADAPGEGAAAPKPALEIPIHIGVDPGTLPDLAVFKDIDAPWCPEMVVIPAGSFHMGSPKLDEGWSEDQGPRHWVTIGKRFAIGRYAVTFDDYDHFCDATGREKSHDAGWGRGRRPVINVSWEDAQALLGVAGERDEAALPVAERGGVGVCLPGGDDDTVQLRGDDHAGAG